MHIQWAAHTVIEHKPMRATAHRPADNLHSQSKVPVFPSQAIHPCWSWYPLSISTACKYSLSLVLTVQTAAINFASTEFSTSPTNSTLRIGDSYDLISTHISRAQGATAPSSLSNQSVGVIIVVVVSVGTLILTFTAVTALLYWRKHYHHCRGKDGRLNWSFLPSLCQLILLLHFHL